MKGSGKGLAEKGADESNGNFMEHITQSRRIFAYTYSRLDFPVLVNCWEYNEQIFNMQIISFKIYVIIIHELKYTHCVFVYNDDNVQE